MTGDSIARLEVKLDHVEPKVMRRVEVPLSLRLDRLHLVLQAAFGWENYHLWQVRVHDTIWGVPDPGGDWDFGPRTLNGAKATLRDAIECAAGKSIKYTCDFGDDWHHTVKLEHVAEAEPGAAYPRLIAASGRCPPEDCGGPPGYADYLDALADPEHERHAEMLEWRGRFDLNALDVRALMSEVAKLARHWTRHKAA